MLVFLYAANRTKVKSFSLIVFLIQGSAAGTANAEAQKKSIQVLLIVTFYFVKNVPDLKYHIVSHRRDTSF